MSVGNKRDDKNEPKCVPFVSEYTDCNNENRCHPGCTKCTCSAQGQWICQSTKDDICSDVDALDDQIDNIDIDEALFDAAINKLEFEMQNKNQTDQGSGNPYVPGPRSVKKDYSADLLDIIGRYDSVSKLKELSRIPRSTANKKIKESKHIKRSTEKIMKNQGRLPRSNNDSKTVKFYSTVDELNEDTLKSSNHSGTLPASKMEVKLPEITRRSNALDNSNKSLHIDFNQPKVYNHITDNRIDTDQDQKLELSHERQSVAVGNNTQKLKDKELSKLVVNELKKGTEVIGDKKAPITSNITFTSENDTLTAMAFIAGNLLNKLWYMEKDASDSSMETENIKREKISDLLELFKEPLNLKQEDFLKHALEQLTSIIDKNVFDVKNISLCHTIEEASKLINKNNEEGHDTPNLRAKESVPKDEKEREKNNNDATIHAISKINDVLALLKKFERLQKSLGKLKNESNYHTINRKNITDHETLSSDALTGVDTNTFNTFGKIIDKMTKLIMPQKKSKRTSQLLKSKSALNDDQLFKTSFMKMYNFDLSNMTVSAKDKLILDYIKHINSNPNCILNKNNKHTDSNPLSNIEGNILLNLSEFFKMKSFADLINLVQSEKITNKPNTLDVTKITTIQVETTTTSIVTDDDENRRDYGKKFEVTKQKLKAHLKTIIEDLIELQNATGVSPKRNIRIVDALPCIYNIMNAGKEIINTNCSEKDQTETVVDLFKNLKNTMKTAYTRRSGTIMKIRPKSAVVLERVIKNLNSKLKSNLRRFFDSRVPSNLEDVIKIISAIKNISSTYKNEALVVGVPAAEKIVLLKALEKDVKLHINALEGLTKQYDNLYDASPDKNRDILEFILNSANNISLGQKVLNEVKKQLPKHIRSYEKDIGSKKILETALPKTLGKLGAVQNVDNNMRISRNQIINHVVRNRMKIYMKIKEAKVLNVHNDMNYNIAKRVLFYLDTGNYNLALELFKVLVMQNQDVSDTGVNDRDINDSAPTPKSSENRLRQIVMPLQQSQRQMEDPKDFEQQGKIFDQDNLIKQLLNIKNLKI